LIFRYIIHTMNALKHIKKSKDNTIFHCTSAFLPDILPAILAKKRNKKSSILVPVFHLFEHYKTRGGSKISKFIAFYEQRFSLFLIKRKADKIIVSVKDDNLPTLKDYIFKTQ
jgi:hypothetical protein